MSGEMDCKGSTYTRVTLFIQTRVKSEERARFDVTRCYRPQTKFVKVMFSQVSVCPRGCLSVHRGMSVCPQGDVCLSTVGEVSVQGVSVQGGPVQGVLCPRGLCPGRGRVRETPCMVICGQCTSYLNAFLLTLILPCMSVGSLGSTGVYVPRY